MSLKEAYPHGRIYNVECLELMSKIPDKSIDMILCDLPYGTTACKWDVIIPFEPLWEQYKRIIKDNGAIVLTASQPFTSALVMSNVKNFKYCWVYQKNKATGHLNAKKQPLLNYEDICVFYKNQCTYNPQMITADKKYKRGFVKRDKKTNIQQSDCYGEQKSFLQIDSGLRYPQRIQYFNNNETLKQLHPTQKPVALFEYLIKTYTNERDLVLDNCAGSFTTAIACINTNRRFICTDFNPEKDKQGNLIEPDKYYKVGKKRIEEHYAKL